MATKKAASKKNVKKAAGKKKAKKATGKKKTTGKKKPKNVVRTYSNLNQQSIGDCGTVSYGGRSVTIEITAADESCTDIAFQLTHGGLEIDCVWDGDQWVCNSSSANVPGY